MSPNATEAENDPSEAEFSLVDLEDLFQRLNPAQRLGNHIPNLFIRPLVLIFMTSC